MLALLLSFFAARNIMRGVVLGTLALLMRRLFDVLRGIDMAIWGLIFVRAVGLGPLAGVLAIIMQDTGLLGRLYAEGHEAVDRSPGRGLTAVGANGLQKHRFGIFTQSFPTFLALSLYQIESNTRSAAVLGFVGAGGIGLIYAENMRLWNWDVVMFITPAAGGGGNDHGHPFRLAAPSLYRRRRGAAVSGRTLAHLCAGWRLRLIRPTRPAPTVSRPGKQLRRRAMASGTELRLCRVAAAPYPAYLSGSDCLLARQATAPPGDGIRHGAAFIPDGGCALPGLLVRLRLSVGPASNCAARRWHQARSCVYAGWRLAPYPAYSSGSDCL